MEPVLYRFVVGPLETNTYLLHSNDRCIIVDPSLDCSEVVEWLRNRSVSLEAILLTHAHFDHIMGIDQIQASWPHAAVWLHEKEMPFLTDSSLNGSGMLGRRYSYDGPVNTFSEGPVTIGGFTLTAVHVPGHTPGGCAYLFDGFCISGDSLFAGSIGRSDFPGGNGSLLIDSIKSKLLRLPDQTVVYPGHGESTTIGAEKRHNPFLI